MEQLKVLPLRSFEFDGIIRRAGSIPFLVPARLFDNLSKRGLVRLDGGQEQELPAAPEPVAEKRPYTRRKTRE